MVGYSTDAMRFMGATFDPSALYRFNAIQRMLKENGIVHGPDRRPGCRPSVAAARSDRRYRAWRRPNCSIRSDDRPHARFLAFRSPDAQRWCADLMARGCVTDVRGDVLRVGFGLYQDEEDVEAFAALGAQAFRRSVRRATSALAWAGDLVGIRHRPTRRSAGRGRRSSP